MAGTDLVAVVRSYLERALREVHGMKVLLLDADTTRTVSTALSQSDILGHEVYLVERLDAAARGEALPHLRAVAYLRPTRDNVARLRRELRDPRFGSYHVCERHALLALRGHEHAQMASIEPFFLCLRHYTRAALRPPGAHRPPAHLGPAACVCCDPGAVFTNRVEEMRLQDLAEGDARGLVAGVQEFYGDFVALEAHHAAVPLPAPHLALAPMSWDFGASADMLARLTEGVAALLLSLRRRFAVRHQRGSELAERLAQTLHHLTHVEQRELFDFGARPGEPPPLLLILDRRDDPVTPLLSQVRAAAAAAAAAWPGARVPRSSHPNASPPPLPPRSVPHYFLVFVVLCCCSGPTKPWSTSSWASATTASPWRRRPACGPTAPRPCCRPPRTPSSRPTCTPTLVTWGWRSRGSWTRSAGEAGRARRGLHPQTQRESPSRCPGAPFSDAQQRHSFALFFMH
jgi:hypothetical protein